MSEKEKKNSSTTLQIQDEHEDSEKEFMFFDFCIIRTIIGCIYHLIPKPELIISNIPDLLVYLLKKSPQRMNYLHFSYVYFKTVVPAV